MYTNRPQGFRPAFGGTSQRNRNFNRPQRGHFNNSRNFNRNKSELNPSLFIKKAKDQTVEAEYNCQNNFTDFPLSDKLQQNITFLGYKQPTPIQDQAIMPILQGQDVIGLANTGTGKTAAFLIPLIEQIFKDRTKKALIIAPTRELAVQINHELKDLAYGMQVYSTILIGGSNMYRQIQDLKRSPSVVIATPGRLKDFINQKILNLGNFNIFILDEVDLMVDIGFINDIKFFVSFLPKVRQSLFFSATISSKVQEVLRNFVTNPITISVKKQDTSENVDQDIIKVLSREKKLDQLHDLLIKEEFKKVLIFGRTKHGVEKLTQQLEFRGFKVGAIHGNKRQGYRQRTLERFKRNEIQILLATDVASRGLDIDHVTHVINYDPPQTFEDYIHRIGRTGRINNKGTALTFVD